MQTKLIFLLFTISIFWSFILISPIRFTMNIGSSEMRETDFLIILLVINWFFMRGNNFSKDIHSLIFALVGILIIPIFIAIFDGKNMNLILRDIRTPLYYLAMIPLASFFRERDNINNFLKLIIITGIIGLSIGIFRWLVIGGVDIYGRTRFAFGGVDSVVWLCFLCIAYLLFQKKAKYYRAAIIITIICLIYIFLANDSRSTYLGTFAGLIFLFMVNRHIKKEMLLSKKFQPKSKVLRNLLLLLIIIGSTINIIVISFEDVFLEISKSNNVVRRLYSLYNPKVDEMGFANREDRMLAVSYAYDLATVNYGLGYGYGDNTFVKLDDEETRRIITGNEIADNPGNLIEGLLLFHNSYAWSLARLGLWLSIIFFIAILKLILRAHKVIYENENQFDRLVLSGSVAFAIYTLVSGFGGGGFFDYMGTGMVPWLFCLAILTSCSEQNQKKISDS